MNVPDSRGGLPASFKPAVSLSDAQLIVDFALQREIEDRGELLAGVIIAMVASALCLRRKHLLQDGQYGSHGARSQTPEPPR